MKALSVATFCCLLSFNAYAEDLNADMAGFPKWVSVMGREHVKAPEKPFTGDLKALLDKLQAKYRRVPYKEDIELYGMQDYWATRAEMKARGAGDCEDFAIAEYFDLIEAGVDDSDAFVVVVLVKETQEIHALLHTGAYWLDRRAPHVMSGDEMSLFYTPIFHINRHGWARG